MPHISHEDVQHSQAILATILKISRDTPHTPADLFILRALTAAATSGRVEHLVRWRVLGTVVLLSSHPFAHRGLCRPLAIEKLLELLLLDVCLFLGC